MEKRYPFKFLASYNQNDTDIFFGRNDEVDALYEMVFQNSILLVYGTSGTGKTSLIQCGLAGRFKSYDWKALMIRRASNINTSLKKALLDAGGDNLDDEDALTKDATRKLTGLSRLVKGVYLNCFKPIYLIFDQFEELYILGTKDEQKEFIESIKEILKAEQPVKMIFSIREEYLGHLYEFEKEVPQLLRKKLRVEPMTEGKVKDVLKGINNYKFSNVKINPVELDTITEGIFKRLRENDKLLTIQLPYLQVYLDKLYFEATKDEKRQADALITLDVLKRVGNIGDVLSNFLDEQVKSISKKLSVNNKNVSSDTIWKVLTQFCTLEGTKEPVSKEDLLKKLKPTGIDENLITDLLKEFESNRILIRSENLYELAHDSLALKIKEQRTAEDTTLMEVSEEIKSQAEKKGVLREYFSEKKLNYFEPFLGKLNLEPAEKELIEESKKIVARKKKKRILIVLTSFIVLFAAVVLMIFLTVKAKKAEAFAIDQQSIAFMQKRNAEISDSISRITLNKLKIQQASSRMKDGDTYWNLNNREIACSYYKEALELISDFPADPLYKVITTRIKDKCTN